MPDNRFAYRVTITNPTFALSPGMAAVILMLFGLAFDHREVVILTRNERAPSGITTLEGTEAIAELELARRMVTPSAGASAAKFMVSSDGVPPFTVPGETEIESSFGRTTESTLEVADSLTEAAIFAVQALVPCDSTRNVATVCPAGT